MTDDDVETRARRLFERDYGDLPVNLNDPSANERQWEMFDEETREMYREMIRSGTSHQKIRTGIRRSFGTKKDV
jgi:hypothetical protein